MLEEVYSDTCKYRHAIKPLLEIILENEKNKL